MWNKLKKMFHMHDFKYKGSERYNTFSVQNYKCICGATNRRVHFKSSRELLADINEKLSKNA